MYINKCVSLIVLLLLITKNNAQESNQTNSTISNKNENTLIPPTVLNSSTEKPNVSDITVTESPSTVKPHTDIPEPTPTTNASTASTSPVSPTSPSSPAPPPPPTSPSPVPPVTTAEPSSTTIPVTTSEAPHHSRQFDGPSFIGGIVLATGLMAIGFVAFKFYKARTERNYHTL